jgi:hypothetical protein
MSSAVGWSFLFLFMSFVSGVHWGGAFPSRTLVFVCILSQLSCVVKKNDNFNKKVNYLEIWIVTDILTSVHPY